MFIVYNDLNEPIRVQGKVKVFSNHSEAIDFLLDDGYKPAHIATFTVTRI